MVLNIVESDTKSAAYEPHFDIKFSVYSGNKEPLSVVTVIPLRGKKHRATIIDSIKCL